MITVLLADDQPLIRAGIAMLLTRQPDLDVVAEANDGQQAVDLCAVHHPDVVVMDLRMPVMDGVEATRRLLAPTTSDDPYRPRILVLTNFHDDDTVHQALRAGAAGFLIKHSSPSELPAGIRTIAAGHHYLHPEVTGGVIASLTAQPARHPLSGILDRLTPREREILQHIAIGQANGEIAARLFLSEATVRTHVSRIIMKLGVHDRSQAVVVAYQNHLIHLTPPPDDQHPR